MKRATFAFTLAIGLGSAAALATLTYSTSAPAAVSVIEGKEAAAVASVSDAALQRNGSADACRQAAWPLIPAGCLRSTDPDRARRPVRVIQIYAAPNNM